MPGTSRRAPWLVGIVAVVVGAGAVGWFVLKPAPGEPRTSVSVAGPSSPGSASAPAPEAPASAPGNPSAMGARAWVAGTEYRYTLDSEQQVSFAPASQAPASSELPPTLRFVIQGDWRVGVVSAEAERIRLRVTLVPTQFSMTVEGQGPIAPEARQSLSQNLAIPFFVTLQPSGSAQLLHFDPSADVLAQGLLRSLVAATQYVLPPAPGATWSTEEFDSTGRYTARYTRQDGGRIEKSKQAYLLLATDTGLRPVGREFQIELSARSTLTLDETSWARSLQGTERVAVDSGPSMPRPVNTLRVDLGLRERVQDASLLDAFTALEDTLLTFPMASYQGQKQDPREEWRQQLGGKTSAELFKALRSLPSETQARDEARARLVEQLRALFLLEPAEALKASAQVRAGMEPHAASTVIGALSGASTPEALRGLSEVMGDSALPVPVRTDATAALGMATQPTEESLSSLRRLSQSREPTLHDTATLGLGNAALMLREEDPGAAASLVHELDTAFRSTRDPEQQVLLLRALGNTRDPSMLPTLQGALRSTSVPVRAAAVGALRGLPGASIDALLASVLLGDTALEVRQSAVFASGFRPLAPLLSALVQALRGDPASLVRGQIIQLLGANLAAFPDAAAALRWSSQNDPDPGLRQSALSFLNPLPPAP